MSRIHRSSRLALLLTSTLLAAACTATVGDETSGSPPQPPRPPSTAEITAPTLAWGRCEPGSAGPEVDLKSFRCSKAEVPLNYADPAGRKIRLAVVKHPATEPKRRIGTLFFNPGGPGGTGTGQFPTWIDYFPAQLRARFDLVSWDPRGVGQSTAPQCFANAAAEGAVLGPLDAFPIDPAGETAWIKTSRDIARRCADRDGELFAYVSTADTARDLEMLRRAVGERSLSYLGVSYGTFLGATYANLFPQQVRAMVLDGNLSPDAWTDAGRPAEQSISTRIGSDVGVAENLAAMLRLCAQAGPERCAFAAQSPAATQQKWEILLERLRTEPLVLGTGTDARTITYPGLVDEMGDAFDIVQPGPGAQGWSGAAAALQQLWQATEARPTPSPGPSTPTPATPPSASSTAGPAAPYDGPEQTWGVICGDAAAPPVDAWPALAHEAERRAGPSGLDLSWGDQICSSWQVKAAQPYAGPWNADTPPLLLLNNTSDPATPYANAEAMGRLLANTRLLTVEGYGHTALLNPSACAQRLEVAYLIDGTLPPEGTTCRQDQTPFAETRPS